MRVTFQTVTRARARARARHSLHEKTYLAGNERLQVFVIIRLLARSSGIPVRESRNRDFFIKSPARARARTMHGKKMRAGCITPVMHMHERVLQRERERQRENSWLALFLTRVPEMLPLLIKMKRKNSVALYLCYSE